MENRADQPLHSDVVRQQLQEKSEKGENIYISDLQVLFDAHDGELPGDLKQRYPVIPYAQIVAEHNNRWVGFTIKEIGNGLSVISARLLASHHDRKLLIKELESGPNFPTMSSITVDRIGKRNFP